MFIINILLTASDYEKCFSVPGIPLSVCLKLTDVSIVNGQPHACVYVGAKLVFFTKYVKIGCFP